MRKILLLTFLLITYYSDCFSQKKLRKWQIVLVCDGYKLKGICKKVTDSSVFITVRKSADDEILFRDIKKIKLRPLSDEVGKRIIGFWVAGISSGIIIGIVLLNGESSQPGSLHAFIGAVVGGIIFGIVGALIAPKVFYLFTAKEIVVQHNPESYPTLKAKLLNYCPH